jgi:DNA-binding PadR family transcriptional regulator
MKEISNRETVILGLLYEHQHYVYRLQEIMEKRDMAEWTDVDYSSIDELLENLEEKKLVQPDIRKGGDTEIYKITDDGKIAFKNKIKSLLSKREKIIYSFNLALANLPVLNSEEVQKSLELYLESMEEQQKILEYSIKAQKKNKVPYNFIAISERSVSLIKAEKKVLKEFMEKISLNQIKAN